MKNFREAPSGGSAQRGKRPVREGKRPAGEASSAVAGEVSGIRIGDSGAALFTSGCGGSWSR